MKTSIRKPYFRERFITVVEGDSMTHESHAASCDINNIVAQFHRTGQLPPARQEGQYGDVTGLQKDLTQAHIDAQNTIQTAEEFGKTYVPKSKRKPKEDEKPKDETDANSEKNPPPATPE